MAILEVRNLKKIYTTRFGGNQVQALADLNFSVEKGEYVAIMGESGSGKTTLLNILAALDKPTAGEVLLNNKNIVTLGEREISKFRRENLGFVFQDFNLLDHFSLKDNILLPLVLADAPVQEMEERLWPIAEKLGIDVLLEKYPYEVSGGQKQRVAIASAIASDKQVIVFDEPTSGLDYRHMKKVAENLRELSSLGKTLFIVTHDPELIAECCNYFVFIENGKVLWSDGWNRISRERLQKFFAFEDD